MIVGKSALTIVLVATVVLTLSLGCGRGGQGLAKVKGTIKYNGKPVPNGTVNFMPDDGNKPSASGEIQPDGTYTLMTAQGSSNHEGAVIGKHKVIIVAMQDMASRLPEERIALPPPIVPTKYTSPATSDLSAEVENKENVIDFDLKDEAK
jgi:hypothetical protein